MATATNLCRAYALGRLAPWGRGPWASALSGFGFGLHRREDFDGLEGLGVEVTALRVSTVVDVLADASDALGEDFGLGGGDVGVHVFCLVQLGMC